jgi:hypothetical protein
VRDGQVVGVWEWNEATEEVDLILFESTPKAVEKAIQKRAVAWLILSARISDRLGFMVSTLAHTR